MSGIDNAFILGEEYKLTGKPIMYADGIRVVFCKGYKKRECLKCKHFFNCRVTGKLDLEKRDKEFKLKVEMQKDERVIFN